MKGLKMPPAWYVRGRENLIINTENASMPLPAKLLH